MLVLVSDLHLTDGSTALNVSPEAFTLLQRQIKLMASEHKATEVHVVLLGDIFDLVRTDYWHQNFSGSNINQRPWRGKLDPKTGMNQDADLQKQYVDVLECVLKTKASQALVGMLNGLAQQLRLEKVKLTYVRGNHDRMFINFPALEDLVEKHFNQENVELDFASHIVESRYGVLARHGHEWVDDKHGWTFHNKVLNKNNKIKDRFHKDAYKVMAIGEVVTAELAGGFIYRIKGKLPPELFTLLLDFNNLRPATTLFEWLDWFAKYHQGVTDVHRKVLHDALKYSLDSILESEFAKKWDGLQRGFIVRGDLVDLLQLFRTLGLGKNFDQFRKRVGLARYFSGLFEGKEELFEGAQEEFKMIRKTHPEIQYIVYGDTHRARHDYLSFDAKGPKGPVVRMYINTGTYLPLISRTLVGKGFASTKQMTMTFFFHEGEDLDNRKDGPSLVYWQGIRRKQYQAATIDSPCEA